MEWQQKNHKMESCPACKSSKYENGICKKCGYKNTSPSGYSFTGLGYKQEAIINLGMKKGSVNLYDVLQFYEGSKVQREMNKLILLGFFEFSAGEITAKWRYVGKNAD